MFHKNPLLLKTSLFLASQPKRIKQIITKKGKKLRKEEKVRWKTGKFAKFPLLSVAKRKFCGGCRPSGEVDLMRNRRAKVDFGMICLLAHSLIFGDFSPLHKRFEMVDVSAHRRFCR